ncbi:MAG TPA: four helix bundle protein [Pirellulaceae bacterium]
MTYERFEDLPVWQDAADLGARLLVWVQDNRLQGLGDCANQLQRSVLSISNNIAEGFERGTKEELITFLYYARGSAAEVRSMLEVLRRIPRYRGSLDQIDGFKTSAESVSRQLRAWAGALQNSEIEGPRRLNDRTRAAYAQKQVARKWQQQRREFFATKEAELKRRYAQATEDSPSDTPPHEAESQHRSEQ